VRTTHRPSGSEETGPEPVCGLGVKQSASTGTNPDMAWSGWARPPNAADVPLVASLLTVM
jgi:hypothetical protein